LFSVTSWLTLTVKRSDYVIREKTVFAILRKWPKFRNRIDELLDRGDQRRPEQRQEDHAIKLDGLSQEGQENHPPELSGPSQEGQGDHPTELSEEAQEEQEDEPDKSSRPLQRDQAHYSAKLERALQSSIELLHDWTQLQPDGEVADKLRGKMRTYQDRLRAELMACTANEIPSTEATPSLSSAEESELQDALDRLRYKAVSKELIAMWIEEESLCRYTPASMMSQRNQSRSASRSVPEVGYEKSGYGRRGQLRWHGRPANGRSSTVGNLVTGMRNMWTKLGLSRSKTRNAVLSEYLE